MIFVTGDCHGDWSRFSSDSFTAQKYMTRDDFVLCCGDFGIWHDTENERYWLNWLEKKSFTICFVDGNHDNFDRLYGGEFPEIDFHGGKAHKIRENIFHLERGYVFEFYGLKFFCFGGAKSHDIADGIISREDFSSDRAYKEQINTYKKEKKMFRINHVSWWKEELPSGEEMWRGLENLEKNNQEVNFVISHCAPQYVINVFSKGFYKPDELTMYFNGLMDRIKFNRWFFGHYHEDGTIMGKFMMLYEQIMRVF